MTRIILHLSCLILLFSCGKTRENDTRLLSELVRSEIKLTHSFANKAPQILVYVGEGACGVCSLKLPEWAAKLGELHLQGIDSVQILFVVCEKEIATMNDILAESHIANIRQKMTVIPDTENKFTTENTIPSDYRFHTFLLDRNNRVVVVGSPIGNPKMWELYKSTIARLVDSGGTLTDRETSITRK